MPSRCSAATKRRCSRPCAATPLTCSARSPSGSASSRAQLKFMADESFDEAGRIERLLNDPRVARDLGDLGEDYAAGASRENSDCLAAPLPAAVGDG